ncbi:MAG: bifunctional phosphopantothenoylcysteine decarboxylase/phosphopantothenate synthase [Gemmataceae bacterium]|nr:bifunctional phosphopantothenoylcysteine decarboxylase/phosphopantothenate synthase [Gemmataceae bacterium]
MNLLVTAGNTQVLIDRVRCLTNIFTGRTGAGIALCGCERGHQVTLLTSHPETVDATRADWRERGALTAYRTFEDLQALMASLIPTGRFDAIIHAAAVSDYLGAGAYALAPGTRFDAEASVWHGVDGPPALVDRTAGKIKSDEPELWLRLVRAPKLVDRIRGEWGFGGQLVKFKLEVGLNEKELLDVAERSRRQSQADWMVANTLEGAAEWAFLGPFADGYHKVSRADLAARLLETLEWRHPCPTSSSA